jgi:hypothetical protein
LKNFGLWSGEIDSVNVDYFYDSYRFITPQMEKENVNEGAVEKEKEKEKEQE